MCVYEALIYSQHCCCRVNAIMDILEHLESFFNQKHTYLFDQSCGV